MKTLDEVIKAWEICDETVTSNCPDCPYDIDCENVPGEDLRADTLHYLKTYRANQQTYAENSRKAEEARERYLEAVKNCEVAENKYKRLYEETSQNFVDTSQNDPDGVHQQLLKCQALLQDFYRNDPLDWETLKQMEGKPVWVVEEGYQTWEYWSLVYWMKDDELTLLNENGQTTYSKNEQGTVWQAYRKEQP